MLLSDLMAPSRSQEASRLDFRETRNRCLVDPQDAMQFSLEILSPRSVVLMTALFSALSLPCGLMSAPATVEFNRDIRPIFSDKCFTCHGPDKANRVTELRFDTEAGAKITLSDGRQSIVPGDPNQSELFRRIASND